MFFIILYDENVNNPYSALYLHRPTQRDLSELIYYCYIWYNLTKGDNKYSLVYIFVVPFCYAIPYQRRFYFGKGESICVVVCTMYVHLTHGKCCCLSLIKLQSFLTQEIYTEFSRIWDWFSIRRILFQCFLLQNHPFIA